MGLLNGSIDSTQSGHIANLSISKEIWDTITNGHLLICDWCFRILKGSKMRSLDSDKRCC